MAEFTDEQIEAFVQKHGAKWDGNHWTIEDADLHPLIRAALSAPQEAGKSQVCGYPACGCNPKHCPLDESKEAGKVEAVADERAMAVVSRHPGLFDERTSAVARLLPEGEHLADGTKLYLRPSQQALGEGEIRQVIERFAGGYDWTDDEFDSAMRLAKDILAAAGGSEK